MNDFNFENQPAIMSDEEFKSALANLLATKRKRTEETISIVDPLRYEMFGNVLKILKFWVMGTDAEVSYTYPESYLDAACITLLGTDVTFSDTNVLSMIAEVASCIDIYPKTDGRVQVDFVFYGLQNELK